MLTTLLKRAVGAATLSLALHHALAQNHPLEVASPKHTLQLVQQLPAPAAAVPPAAAQSNYLLVYFKDETHDLYFATSADGYSFTDVNDGQPVALGRVLAEQKGLRDPHLMRGPDGAFYLAMTDLHIYGKKQGHRDTEWERPIETHGWGNNKNLILMKSLDLIHWTHHRVNVAALFPSEGDLGCVWAPETIWDDKQGKPMVYYTTRVGAGQNHLVYSYADAAFSTLEAAPRSLFTYPVPGKSAIDGDITKIGDKYHLFYVAHDNPGNLRQAISDRINEGYVFSPQKVDPETVATEAPTLWRRHGTDTYVLMYDVFGAKPRNNMGFSETRDFVNFKNLGRFNEPGSPMTATNFVGAKHGAVIAVTPAEVLRLKTHFGAH